MEKNSIKKEEKVVVYIVGFSHAPSLGIQKHANFSLLLREKDIENFKEKRLI